MNRKQTIKEECARIAVEVAKRIGCAAWYEQADKVLTAEEKAEVCALWDVMPGSSCWNDAFLAWMQK